MSIDIRGRVRCDECNKYCRPLDSRTTFGAKSYDPPEPHDPEYFCKRCTLARYKKLKQQYSCCYRSGDWEKSKAEIKAAEEAGLVWIHSTGLVEKFSGREIRYQYIRKSEQNFRYVPYLEYEKQRRNETRCKCWRKKNEEGNCPTCNRAEVFCLCRYDFSNQVF